MFFPALVCADEVIPSMAAFMVYLQKLAALEFCHPRTGGAT